MRTVTSEMNGGHRALARADSPSKIGRNSDRAAEGSKSLRRALLLVRTVAAHDDTGMRLTDLASSTELHTTTTHRLLSALQDEGMISFDPNTKLYKLGLEMLLLAQSAHRMMVKDQLHPVLMALAQECGEDVHSVVPTGDDSVLIDKVEGTEVGRITSPAIGCRRPIGVGAGSIALLTAVSDAEARSLYERNLPHLANVRWTTPDRIWRDIVAARRRGFSVVKGQLVKDATAISVAALNNAGEPVASVTVFGPNSRLKPSKYDRIAELIRQEIIATGEFRTVLCRAR
ncbi:IclR family transcriptional regulator [Mesorhizobium sp. M0019]|uniref:IclR family transcriptional regulator n=1 Tax=Mesorhizobium sp. M0019 TaxID=2956845 RepID=UPI00333AB7DA